MAWLGIAIVGLAIVLLVLNHDAGSVAGIDADNFSRLAAGAALALVIGSGLIFSYRRKLGTALRHALLWVLIAVGVMGGYVLRDEVAVLAGRLAGELVPGYASERTGRDGTREVVLQRRLNGHFVAGVAINGREVNMLVDTGASVITLTPEDAQRAGIELERLAYTARVATANGTALAAPVTLDEVVLSGIAFSNMRALVAAPGRLNESLLGINFLSRLSSYEVRGEELILRAPRG